ncbi:MAG: hypothetical protein ACRENL_07505 [Candidatus Dormibacteria bacterium]
MEIADTPTNSLVSQSFAWRLMDREAKYRGLALHVGRDRLEPDRSATGALIEANTPADEDRSDMHDDLVHKPGLQTLAGDIGAQDDDVRTFGGLLDNRTACSIPISRNWPVTPLTTGGCAGGS